MALIKFGHLISEARGKLNGTVFSRNTYGSYMRSKVTPSNPATNAQNLQRSKLTAAAQAWRALTDAARLSWEALAKELSRTNVFGDNVPLTGFNCFVRLNNYRLLCGQTLLTTAPVPYSPTSVTGVTFDDISSSVVSIDVAPGGFTANDFLLIFLTPCFSKGVSFVKGQYRLIKVAGPSPTTPVVVTTEYVAKFGAPVTGKKVSVKVFSVDLRSGIPGPVRSLISVVG